MVGGTATFGGVRIKRRKPESVCIGMAAGSGGVAGAALLATGIVSAIDGSTGATGASTA